MFKEITNNIYGALFVAANEEGRRYAAFDCDWNGEYWEAAACTESGEIVKGETIKLYPVNVYHAEADQFEEVGYDEEAARILIPGWRDYQKRGYNESYTIAPVAYNEASDRVYFNLPEGASVYNNAAGLPVIDYDGFTQDEILNQRDAQGCRAYVEGPDQQRVYLDVIEL